MKNILSVLVASLFLASQVGFAISTHFCGGKVFEQSLGINHSEMNCGMEAEAEVVCETNGPSVSNNCCDDDFQNLIILDDFKTQSENVEFNKHLALAFAISYFELLPIESNTITENLYFIPPPLVRNISVLNQTFLI